MKHPDLYEDESVGSSKVQQAQVELVTRLRLEVAADR